MTSGWAHFRKVWLKPEVYPLIGAMAAALGVMTASLINKARHPTVAWNKGKRGTGTLFDDVDEVVPLWAKSKNNSTSIFGADSSIEHSKTLGKDDLGTFVLKSAAEEEEEQEEEVDEQPEQPEQPEAQPVAEEPAVVQPLVDVIDESAEAINAAVDAAIETAKSINEAPAPPASPVPPASTIEAPAAEEAVEDVPVEQLKAAES